MPTLPKTTKCDALGGKDERAQGSAYCEAHTTRKKPTAARIDANAHYRTAAWKQARITQLSTQPLCQACKLQGRIVAAAHVDHVIPWQAIGEHAFHRAKLQSLCPNCHSVKTGLEQRGIFRHYTDNGAIDYTAADYGHVITLD